MDLIGQLVECIPIAEQSKPWHRQLGLIINTYKKIPDQKCWEVLVAGRVYILRKKSFNILAPESKYF